MENNENIIPVSEVSDSDKICKFCKNKIENDMVFCTFCGKSQIEEKTVKKPKKIFKKIKRKRVSAAKAFSFTAFTFSFVLMIYAVIRMFVFNTPTASIFGTSYETLVVNHTVVTGSLLLSIIFLKLGIFLYKL